MIKVFYFLFLFWKNYGVFFWGGGAEFFPVILNFKLICKTLFIISHFLSLGPGTLYMYMEKETFQM